MPTLAEILIEQVMPKANDEAKKKLLDLVEALTSQNPKAEVKNYLINTLIKEFISKNQDTQKESFSENLSILEILKRFGISAEQYEKLKGMGISVVDIFNLTMKKDENVNTLLKTSNFSLLEVYIAIAQAILKYGLGDKFRQAFHGQESLIKISDLIKALVDLKTTKGTDISSKEFIEGLIELIRLVLTSKNSKTTEKFLLLLGSDSFKEFLSDRNAAGLSNLAYLRKPTIEDILEIFTNAVSKLSEVDYNFKLYVGTAKDETVLGMNCELIKSADELRTPLMEKALTFELINKIKENSEQECHIIYVCHINELSGVIVFNKKLNEDWQHEEKVVLNKETLEIENSEIYNLIASKLHETLNHKN
jgi:hypothetical protein